MLLIPNEVVDYVNKHAVGNVQFCNWLDFDLGEIVQYTFAFRKRKNANLEVIEVMRRKSNCDFYFVRNIFLTFWGYRAYFDENAEFERLPCKRNCPIHLTSYCINPNVIFYLEKYQYCAYPGGYVDPIVYLNTYTKYPGLELLTKLGIPLSITILKFANKDKQFCKYVYKNASLVRCFGPEATIYAYKNNKEIKDSAEYLSRKRSIEHDFNFYFCFQPEIDKQKLKEYLLKKQVSLSNYADYYSACQYLKLDMTEDKNAYPKDFMRMHDMRINQKESQQRKENLRQKRELNKDFKQVSNKYKSLEYTKEYSVFIAPNIQSLVREGKFLHHCVGEMGYDAKMAKEKSLIFFIRKLDEPTKPFVTMEYSPSDKRILQVYGYHDVIPDDDVLEFTNHWLKIANRRLKKIC